MSHAAHWACCLRILPAECSLGPFDLQGWLPWLLQGCFFSGTRDDGLDNGVTSPAVLAGEITSRLSADTTTVSDQICLNLNVGLRSLTQAAMVLVFMFRASWRLSVITFIIIPAIILITKVYGAYYRQVEM